MVRNSTKNPEIIYKKGMRFHLLSGSNGESCIHQEEINN